jgi:hypothetical protein
VVGICASRTASAASWLPGTATRTPTFGEPAGIFRKSAGKLELA